MSPNGLTSVVVNYTESSMLYASVFGSSESLYDITITFTTLVEGPNAYTMLEDNDPTPFPANESTLVRY